MPEPSHPEKATLTYRAARRLVGVFTALAAVVAASYVVPALHPYRPWVPQGEYVPFWNVFGRSWVGSGTAEDREQTRHAQLLELARASPVAPAPPPPPTATAGPEQRVVPARELLGEEREPPLEPLENAAALAHYFRKLALVEIGTPKTLARASHWGDSVLGDDELTHAVRSRLQARFGDGGHGFHVLAPFNRGYQHRGMRYRNLGGWSSRCEVLFQCEADARYGLGGTSSRSFGTARAWFATAESGFGHRASRFELWYHRFPEGGRLGIFVDGQSGRVVDTAEHEPRDAVEVVEVPDGPHEFAIEGLGGGALRGYGVVLEREGPGVVWDGLAVIGSLTGRFDTQEGTHIQAQIARRQSDLLVFMVGGNDLRREPIDLGPTGPYDAEYRSVLRKYRAGAPHASCLILSIVDHGARVNGDRVVSRAIVGRMVEAQRRVALAEGCAFFDTYRAMGGRGSVARWLAEQPPLMNPDLNHPTTRGYELLGALFYRALIHAYGAFRQTLTGQDIDQLARSARIPSAALADRDDPTKAKPTEAGL